MKKILKDCIFVGNVYVKLGKMNQILKKFLMEFKKWVKVFLIKKKKIITLKKL